MIMKDMDAYKIYMLPLELNFFIIDDITRFGGFDEPVLCG
jgi:hypothetical protein